VTLVVLRTASAESASSFVMHVDLYILLFSFGA
jgi:hypothetical protein